MLLMTITDKMLLLLLLIINIVPAVVSLFLENIIGPSSIENGTIPRLILDCPYRLRENEKDGLVIKWFYNQNPFPVYQWIPGNKPQDLGLLKGRLDLNYTASDKEWEKHRALAILSPTTELSGEYSCRVSSFEGEAAKSKRLVVYKPATEAVFKYTKPSSGSVLVTCDAIGLFPEPQVKLYKQRPSFDRLQRHTIQTPDISRQTERDGTSYNVSIRIILFDYELRGDTIFICEVILPGTDYKLKERLLYTPGRPRQEASVSSARSLTSRSSSYLIFSISLSLLLLWKEWFTTSRNWNTCRFMTL